MQAPLDWGCPTAGAKDGTGSGVERRRRHELAAFVTVVSLATAALSDDASARAVQTATNESEPAVSDEIRRPIPENAIPTGDDLYMVPLGKDGDGCEQFSLFSPTKMVATVIYYRAKDGGFTTDKLKADCG